MTDPARRIASLTGWGRFLCRTQDHLRMMARVEKIREGGNWGIGVKDDDWALVWQRLSYRHWRAQRAFNPIGCRSYSYTGDGPLTLGLFPGVSIPGWVGKTDAEYATINADSFDKNYRQKAVRAKRLLVERHGPDLGGRLTGLLDEHDHQEAMAEAYGG